MQTGTALAASGTAPADVVAAGCSTVPSPPVGAHAPGHARASRSGSRALRQRAAAVAYRLLVGVTGAVVVLVGLVLVPLPGPGWPIVFVGLAVLGSEFRWARWLSRAVQVRLQPARTWLAAASWPWRTAVGVGLVACALGPALVLA